MQGFRFINLVVGVSLVVVPVIAAADTSCPAAVTDAAKKAYPDAAIKKCKVEKDVFEVKLTKKDGAKVELDITAKGEIEQTEEVVPVASLPEAVTKAFAAKYPKAKAERAEKQDHVRNGVSYEIAFTDGKSRKEATFKADGTFVEEE